MAGWDKSHVSLGIFCSVVGGLILYVLQNLIDLPACSLFFSRWVAMEFHWFIVCPQKVAYAFPSFGSWFLVTMLLLICVFCIMSIRHSTKNGRRADKFDVVFLCFATLLLCTSTLSIFQTRSAVQFYEQFCLAHFQVAVFDESVARQFQIRMSKVETVADIKTILSEMVQYVDGQIDDTPKSNTDSQTESKTE